MTEKSTLILHIPSLEGGGAERVAIEIGKYFESRGISTTFFVHTDGTVYDLPAATEVVVARSKGHFGRVLELRSLIKSRKPAAILSFLPYANLISLFANLGLRTRPRLVLSEHLAFSAIHAHSVMGKMKWILRCWLYQASYSIVAVSKGVAADLQRTLRGRIADKIVVIYNPCYIPNAIVPEYQSGQNGGRILAVGRLVDDKGFDVLIRAFALVRRKREDASLVIAGEGPRRQVLEGLVKELGLSDHVSLPGFVRDVSSLYRNADLFVCSSRIEGFGNVLVEAMSFGLRVVATQCPHGPQEILDGGRYGRLVPVEDERGLACAIADSLSSPHNPSVQIARAQDFSLDVIGARYLEQTGISVPVPAPAIDPSGCAE